MLFARNFARKGLSNPNSPNRVDYACMLSLKLVEQGFPIWSTYTFGGTFAYLKGYI